MAESFRRFTLEELKQFNGEEGKPIYVAYGDRVIDVTASRLWRNGTHMKRHKAGDDLTEAMADAPHTEEVLSRFPQIGILDREEREEVLSGALPVWLDTFLDRHPFFRRHPHPMTVHFPIVFLIGAPFFTFLYLLTHLKGFEITAVNCLAGGLLFCLVVIPTGFITWWVNYMLRPLAPVRIKIYTSIAMFVVGLTAFVWRLADPSIVIGRGPISILYFALIFLLLPMILVVAWHGAMLTFPLRAEHRK